MLLQVNSARPEQILPLHLCQQRQQQTTKKMRASRVNTDIAHRIKQIVVLFILIIAGIIASFSAEAKDDSKKADHRSAVVKKQVRCMLMHAPY